MYKSLNFTEASTILPLCPILPFKNIVVLSDNDLINLDLKPLSTHCVGYIMTGSLRAEETNTYMY